MYNREQTFEGLKIAVVRTDEFAVVCKSRFAFFVPVDKIAVPYIQSDVFIGTD